MKAVVDSGEVPGLLAYEGRAPVGWAALGPRETYKRLEKSRVCRPPDDKPAWSLPCFFTSKDARGKGVSVALLKAAARYAKSKGAERLEGYPVDPAKKQPAGFVWWGLAGAFRKAGFKEVLRRSRTRPIMRKEL
jgi:GNAT superfamily N-acetyltransferase